MKVKHANVSLLNALTISIDNPTDFWGCEIYS